MSDAVALTQADWLDGRRVRLYAAAFATMLLSFLIWIGAVTALHASARPIALDFAAFWAAAHLAAAGHASGAYNNILVEATERAAADMPPGCLAFYYPPTFLLLILPLGWLGYSAALAAFLSTEMAIVLILLRRILPQHWGWLPLLSFPGFLMNGLSGQNAALSGSCLAGAAIWLERRPALAGCCLGALACKPQLAACVPVALLAARRWRALGACAATACALAGLSWLTLGAGTWHGFLANAPMVRANIEVVAIIWPKMQSLFGAIRLAGGGNSLAYAAQAVVSIAAVALLARTCARRPGARLEAAALATAALLFTPYVFDYDLAILAVPLACFAALARETGWRRWEQTMVLAAFMLPLAARPLGLGLGVIVGPPLLFALLALIALRARVA